MAAPDRNLALELVRVTEAAALAASGWVGRGQKESADEAAVDAMRLMLDTVEMQRRRRDRRGREGRGADALQRRGGRQRPRPGGRRRRRPARGHAPDRARHAECDRRDRRRRARHDVLPRRRPLHGQDRRRPARPRTRSTSTRPRPRTSARVAEAKGMEPNEVTVVVLERDRHEALIAELRESGARVNLIRDGDVAPSIAAAQAFTGVDMLMGIGGTPEGVISAAAIKCMGGAIQGRLWPRNDEERQALRRRRLRRRPRAHDRRPRRRRGRLRRGHGRHERRAPARRARQRGRRRDRVDRDALALGHGAAHRRLPSLREDQTFEERRARWPRTEQATTGLHETAGDSSRTTGASSPPTRAPARSRSASTRSALESTEENRRAYRDMLFTTPELGEFVSGVILYDETIRQSTADGTPFPELLAAAGSSPGSRSTRARRRSPSRPARRSPRGSTGCASGSRSTATSAPASRSGAR